MNVAPEPDLTIDPEASCRILEGFLASEIRRTGARRAVFGLSGGLDSAVVAHLAVRALGPAAVTPVLLPYRSSSAASVHDAEKIVAQLGVVAERVDISPIVDGFLATTPSPGRLRLGNAMARARMIVLYDRSAELGALVVGTSNKTELLLGYGTLHGDLASALNPLGDLYKTQVRQLAAWLDVPASIRRKPPSADLWPDQSDEDELGFSYGDVDQVLALLVDGRLGRDAIVKRGWDRKFVDRVERLLVRMQFKRRPPVIAKVSTRSLGWDFRYPRDWRT
ncbi:MAG TPA: NAD+ synthase [Candidatus Polarisedimenticolaceae bacterium]